jgi:hypothetical protein
MIISGSAAKTSKEASAPYGEIGKTIGIQKGIWLGHAMTDNLEEFIIVDDGGVLHCRTWQRVGCFMIR